MQNHVEKRRVDLQCAVVFDEAELAELVHEEADARPSGTHLRRQDLLIDLAMTVSSLAPCQNWPSGERSLRQTLLARIEQLIDQVRFDAGIARQQIANEELGELGLLVEHTIDGGVCRASKVHSLSSPCQWRGAGAVPLSIPHRRNPPSREERPRPPCLAQRRQ